MSAVTYEYHFDITNKVGAIMANLAGSQPVASREGSVRAR